MPRWVRAEHFLIAITCMILGYIVGMMACDTYKSLTKEEEYPPPALHNRVKIHRPIIYGKVTQLRNESWDRIKGVPDHRIWY